MTTSKSQGVSATRPTGEGKGRRQLSFKFVGESVAELRRVSWPTRQETMHLTLVVIAIAATVGLFLGFIDILMTILFDVILTA